MRRILLLLLLSFLYVVGCIDSPIAPKTADSYNYSLIKLPPHSNLSVESIFTKSELITGEEGGVIRINEFYWSDSNQIVKVDEKLTIPEDAFNGSVIITMKIDDEYAGAYFEPSMTFDKPLEFNLNINGIDLSELEGTTSDSHNFIYIADNGSTKNVTNDGIYLDNFLHGLTVHNAQLNHFSRYAFSR
jgi:hypothetical protein